MSWMLINLSLAVVFFGAFAGVPLYLVLTNPSFSAQPDGATAASTPARHHTGAAAEHILLPPGALVNAAS